jgi:hypothetical protein
MRVIPSIIMVQSNVDALPRPDFEAGVLAGLGRYTSAFKTCNHDSRIFSFVASLVDSADY